MKERIKEIVRYREFKHFFEKYNHFFVPVFILGGVVVDFITFRTINTQTAFILLGIHYFLAGILMTFVYIYDSKEIEGRLKIVKYSRIIAPLIIQFNFGALLSASFIFYWFSGSLSVSWPIMILLIILMGSNEVLRDYYQRPVVQICVYYFITFSIFSLILPFAFNSISTWIFIFGGLISLLVIAIYLYALPGTVFIFQEKKRKIVIIIAIIFCLMNVLYFADVIPPIPLSLREVNIVHDIEASGGVYNLHDEKQNIFQEIWPGETFHAVAGDDAYIFASVFAPGKLDTLIVHSWQYYNPKTRKWIDSHKASYEIVGGRVQGYRGYSLKSNITEGRWRVNIETESGQTLGRVKFTVKKVQEPARMEWLQE
ncbi:DUF2914 domain-containing protein [Patescibacteria group bacterium]|nr:DUF2914 domain-containing protein [Patescibacteria group bacterium]